MAIDVQIPAVGEQPHVRVREERHQRVLSEQRGHRREVRDCDDRPRHRAAVCSNPTRHAAPAPYVAGSAGYPKVLVAASVYPVNAFATRYNTASIDGLEVFYREAGDPANPTCFCCTAFRPAPTCSAT